MFFFSKRMYNSAEVELSRVSTIYNQYLIRNYSQRILRCQAAKLWFGRFRILQLKGVGCKVLEVRRELQIKIRECFMRVNIGNRS